MTQKLKELMQYKIAVLAGGDSREREISLKSGKAVFNALKNSGLDVILMDVKEDGFETLIEDMDIDIAFIALHGKFGEDGKIQKILSDNDIIYTGSGPESSFLAIDKVSSKKRFAAEGLNIPAFQVLSQVEDISLSNIKYPCVVKPRYEGSSVGLSVIDSEEMLDEALSKAGECDQDIILEEYIKGREIAVGILENDALPVIEIITSRGVYDYNAKYWSKDTRYVVPAHISETECACAKETALKAHRSLGCSGFSRVDMRMDSDGTIFVLEVNTIPGLTERSLLPMAARNAGLDFSELCVNMLYGAITKGGN